MRMNRVVTRRRFLSGAASALALPTLIPARALGRDGAVAPSNRLGLAVIGLGDRGNYHLSALASFKEVQVLAMCDVRGDALRQVCGKFHEKIGSRDCVATQDFREILARPEVDAITVAAPENWHAVMSVEAMKAGKDVYCEKALALTVAEGRAICDAVQRTGRILQAGTQQRSDRRFRVACELARNGYLGKLRSVYVAVPSGRRMLKIPPAPQPPDVNYDLWLGPAPYKPYRENLCNYNWYFLTDYCAGWIQSWGVHHLDIALWGAPELAASALEIEGTADFLAEGDADVSFGWKVAVTTTKGLRMDFYDDASGPLGHGVRFIGDKGWVHVTRGGIKAEPASLLDVRIKPGEERLYHSENHMENFLQCIRSRREPVAPARVCHAATTLSLVADIASRAGRKLVWDWGKERFANDASANRMLSRTLRQPWHV